MKLLERIGWKLIANCTGYNVRCNVNHVIPRYSGIYTFCRQWCASCNELGC